MTKTDSKNKTNPGHSSDTDHKKSKTELIPLSEADESIRQTVDEIYRFFRRPQDFGEDSTWPCTNIEDVAGYLVAEDDDEPCVIPRKFVKFLKTDFRMYDNLVERCHHMNYYMCEDSLPKINKYWLKVLERLLNVYTGLHFTRSQSLNTIIRNIGEGLNCVHILPNQWFTKEDIPNLLRTKLPDPQNKKRPTPIKKEQEEDNDTEDEKDFKEPAYKPDLSKCINIFTNLFPDSERPSADETEPFLHKLQPILEQLKTSNIPEEHQVATVYSVIKGEAREVTAL